MKADNTRCSAVGRLSPPPGRPNRGLSDQRAPVQCSLRLPWCARQGSLENTAGGECRWVSTTACSRGGIHWARLLVCLSWRGACYSHGSFSISKHLLAPLDKMVHIIQLLSKQCPHTAWPSLLEPTGCGDGTIRGHEGEAQQRQRGTVVLEAIGFSCASLSTLTILNTSVSCVEAAAILLLTGLNKSSGPTLLLWRQSCLQWWSLFCIILINNKESHYRSRKSAVNTLGRKLPRSGLAEMAVSPFLLPWPALCSNSLSSVKRQRPHYTMVLRENQNPHNKPAPRDTVRRELLTEKMLSQHSQSPNLQDEHI